MNFGYFFTGMHFSSDGAVYSTVQIRPMDSGTAVDAGFAITIRVPVRTAQSDLPLSTVAAEALQAAQQLLPESALSAWLATQAGENLPQPCLPMDALDRWNSWKDIPPAI